MAFSLKRIFGVGSVSTTSKSIKESGIGLVSSSSTSEFDAEPQNVSLQEQYNNAYNNYPIVAAAIDVTTEQSVQEFRWEGKDSEDLEMWSDYINASELFYQIQKMRLKNGNCWIEWSFKKDPGVEIPQGFPVAAPLSYTILPPEQMITYREKTGKVIGYAQESSGRLIALWGSTGDKSKDSTALAKGKFENMTHFKFNAVAADKYGTSLIHSTLSLLKIKDQSESAMGEIMARYASPIIHASVGDETHPPASGDIDTVSSQLEDIYTDTEYVTSYLVKMNVLGFEGKAMNFDALYGHVDSNIIAGLQVPPELIGLSSSNKSESEVKLRSFGRHIKSIQRGLKVEFEDKVVYGLMKLEYENKLIFDYAEEREREIEIDTIRGLVTDRIITPQKANSLLPPKYAETLPVEYGLPQNTQGQSQAPYQKGGDKVKDNPNDPTVKQKDESGDNQRRTKTDKASTT